MAKTREIYVAAKYKRGFKHSFSSYEAEHGEYIELEEGDNKRDVRNAAQDRLNQVVKEEVEDFLVENDRPEHGKARS